MRPITTDVVAWYVCLYMYVAGMNPAKTAELIEMPFGRSSIEQVLAHANILCLAQVYVELDWELSKQHQQRSIRICIAASAYSIVYVHVCCHSNATQALIANLPNSAQLGGTRNHSPKLYLGSCSSDACGKGQTYTYSDRHIDGHNQYTLWTEKNVAVHL